MQLRFLTAGESHGPALTVIIEDAGPGVTPRFEDVDGDGKRDLICYGQDGGVRVFRNQGEKTAPVLEEMEAPAKDASEICGGYRSRLDVVDWNGDGKLDLVYGVTDFKDAKCRVYVFLRAER